MAEHELFDVTIVGGGPAGLYSAFYSGMRGMKTKILEYQPVLGGKVNVYPEKVVWDVGGLPPTSGEKLIAQMVEQAMTFQPTVCLNEKVASIIKNDAAVFEITNERGEIHYSKTVIMAIGGGILNPQKLELEGAEKYEISNLHYTVKSLARFKGKNVIISGGGNSAIDWANALEPIAEKVFLTYRKECPAAHEAQVDKLMCSSAECYFNTCISKLIAEKSTENIDQVELTNVETGERSTLPIDEVIINHGYERDKSLLESNTLKIDMIDSHFIAGNPLNHTSVPGMFAAGDIVKHDAKLNLIAGCFQDAANAVNQAKYYIQPEAGDRAMVSSHNEAFKEKNKKWQKKSMA